MGGNSKASRHFITLVWRSRRLRRESSQSLSNNCTTSKSLIYETVDCNRKLKMNGSINSKFYGKNLQIWGKKLKAVLVVSNYFLILQYAFLTDFKKRWISMNKVFFIVRFLSENWKQIKRGKNVNCGWWIWGGIKGDVGWNMWGLLMRKCDVLSIEFDGLETKRFLNLSNVG